MFDRRKRRERRTRCTAAAALLTAALSLSCGNSSAQTWANPLPRGATSGAYAEAAVALGLGLGGADEALGLRITGLPTVASAGLGFERALSRGWSVRFAVGGARAWRRGRVGAAAYRARAWRATAGAQVGARVADRGHAVYAGADVRNGRAFADFDRRIDGNLRWRARLDYVHILASRVALAATLTTPLSDRRDVRVLVDAGALVGLGVRYRFGVKPERHRLPLTK